MSTSHTPPLATRLSAAKPSPILAIAQLAKELQAAGKPVISLSVGVPGFLPPAGVYDAARAALSKDSGDYGVGRGDAALVKAWVGTLARKGLTYDASEVCVQVGGKGGLFNVLLALVNAGTEVVIPAPYWTSYPDMVALAGGTPVIVPCPASQNYKLTPAQLRTVLDARAGKPCGLLFNNPSNPTGMVYDPAEVAAVAEVLKDYPNVWVISDDIYDELGFTGTKTAHLLDTAPSLRDRLIIAHSVSKTYGMVGWRVGLLAGPKAIMDGVLLLTSQSSTCVPFMAQAGAAEALSGDQTFLTDVLKTLQTKRDLLLAAVQRWGWECPVPEGAFYLFPQVTSLFGRTLGGTVIDSAATLAKVLLTEAHVAVVPGAAFGDAGAVRLSYGAKEAEIVTAIARIDALLAA